MGSNPFENVKKGALRKQLGVPSGRNIPEGLLERIAGTDIGNHVQYRGKSFAVTPLLKKRAVWAKTFRREKEDDD